MGTIEFWLSVIAIILSVFSLCGNIYVYFRHDRRIKLKEEKSLDLELKQKQEAEDEKKKAKIVGEVNRRSKYMFDLVFENIGLSEARNIKIQMVETDQYPNGCIEELNKIVSQVPNKMKPSQTYSCSLILCTGDPELLIFQVVWDDDFKENNSQQIEIELF